MGKQPECVQGDLIYVVVRNNEHIEEIAVRLSQRIGELKTLVARRFNVNMRQLCLIYAGRVLADTENLFDCNMTHGCTVHLVIRDDQVDTCRFKNCVLQSIAASSTDNTRLEEEDTTDEADPVAHLLSNDKFLGTLRKLHPEFQNVVLNPDVVNIIRHPNMLQEYLKAFTDDFEDTSDDDQDADLENTMTGMLATGDKSLSSGVKKKPTRERHSTLVSAAAALVRWVIFIAAFASTLSSFCFTRLVRMKHSFASRYDL